MAGMTGPSPSRGLPYATPAALRYPSWYRVVGAFSILAGCVGLALNTFVAAAMFKQLYKQAVGRGATRRPIEPWLLLTGTEAAAAAALAVFAVVAGAVTLARPRLGRSLHRRFAWAKLPLACVFAVCAGWGMNWFVSGEPQLVGAAAALGLLVAGAYPLFLLRTLPAEGQAAATAK